MKKLFFTFALSAICSLASAQTLSVPDVEVKAGEKASFTLIVNTGDFKARGFEYHNLVLPEGVTLTKKTTTANSSFSITISDDLLSGFCGALTADEFPQNEDYEVGTIELEVGSDLTVGTTLEVTFPQKSFMFYNSEGSVYVEEPVTFNVKIVDAYTVVLDENAIEVPADAEHVNVTVKRTINAGEWSTICLPFAMPEEQVKKAFGDDVKLGDFTGCEVEQNSDEEVVGIKVKFSDATAIEANHPYIIKVSTAIKEFNAGVVDIAADEAPSVDMDETRVKIGSKWYTFYNSIIGTYVAETEVPENNLFISENKFWYSKGATKMKAFRAYFEFQDLLKGIASESRFTISFDEQTGVGQIASDVNDGEYYNLNGLRVDTPSKGIYIKNGKKVVVK